ncbi:Peptidase inhibitor I78 family [Chelatococcus sambhunathii]|uniref:Peptidase inhibitor I78 family protein n=3 Tax=Chelatococcaceae TaxID=2036754 RepID=A0AAC9JUK0_9HYPH|nr:hypothetical protein BOQ54_06845 [Chelatococcus daeguensis]CUA87880.1 Peptidase inhibitor I78 family [Chelatococcus sambhunathii]
MIKESLLPAVAAALLGMAVSACTPSPATDSAALAPGPCRPEATSGLVGKPKPADDEAKQITGATAVRQIAPGQPVTMDYAPARVTVETDPRTGRVVRAFCG